MSLKIQFARLSFVLVLLAGFFVQGSQPFAEGANYSPGGLGTSDLNYWLDANYGVETTIGVPADASLNQEVEVWKDRSGSNDAIQNTVSARPTYQVGGPNSSNTLFFAGSGGSANPKEWMSTAASTTVNNFSVFAVAQRNGTHGIDAQSTSGTGGTSGQYYLFGPTHKGSNGGSGLSVGTNGISAYEHGSSYMPSLATWNPGGTPVGTGFNIIGYEYTAKQPSIYLNGTLEHTGLTSTKANVYSPSEVGGNANYGGLDGHVTEAFVFNRVLNTTEKVLVNNYLSSKYNLTISGDRYLGDTIANGDYDWDVFGVGRTSGSDAVTAAGSAGLNIQNANLDNNEFLLAGHAESTNALIQDGGKQRWQRVFYLDNNGGSIDADLEFNFTEGDILFPSLSDDQELAILFAEDSSLQWSKLSNTANILGDTVTFQLTNIQSGYYTLGIVTPIPEPNSLLLLSGGMMMLLFQRQRKQR